MDIHNTSRRPPVDGAAIDAKKASIAPAGTRDAAVSTHAAVSGQATGPATTQQLSTSALFLSLLKILESKHPQEAKALLLGIADKLRAQAKTADALAPSLNAWATSFERAADSGEFSGLLPNVQPAAHFGVRAYQVAWHAQGDLTALDAVISQSLTSTDTPAAVSSEASAVAQAQSLLGSDADGGEHKTASVALLDPALVRRVDYAVQAGQRLRRRRSQRRRERRRWRRRGP